MTNFKKPENKNTSIILITNHFPFGVAEAFIENEIGFLVSSFRRVIVIARDVTAESSRPINFETHRLNPQSDWKDILQIPFLYLKNFNRAFLYFVEEIKYLKSKKTSIGARILGQLFHDLTKAIITGSHIRKIIATHHLKGNLVLYSYWLNSSALALTFVRSKGVAIKRIARAHGGDIYESRQPSKYLSFRQVLIHNLDQVFAISENGSNHLKNQVSTFNQNKITISRLGTPDSGRPPILRNQLHKLMVSCSFLVPVKQVHLIIEALALVNEQQIEWVHIGDGPLLSELNELASISLSSKSNIKYRFIGVRLHAEVLQFYKDNFVDLFVNTSESEGVPVTMMEAQSFEIPIVAFNVGGVSEIVSEENGCLLPSHSSPSEIAKAISGILNLPEERYQILRKQARLTWQNRYNAELNFSTFVAQIIKLQHDPG